MFSVLHRWTPWLKRSKLNCPGKLKIEVTEDSFHMFQTFYSKLWSSVTAVFLPLLVSYRRLKILLLLPESSAKAGAGSQAKDLCDALKEQHQLCELQVNCMHFPFDGSLGILSKDQPGVLEHRLSLSTDMSIRVPES